ncbi:hypothetical protein BH10ACT3_BH10ACT3_04520 [soil metagenome]
MESCRARYEWAMTQTTPPALPKKLRSWADDTKKPSLGRHPDVGDITRYVAARGALRLIERDPGVREGTDPEAVHQARVATRRLRADLKSLEPILDRRWTKRIRDELKWLGAILGEVRELDVLQGHLNDAISESDDLDPTGRDGDQIISVMVEQRRLRHLELVDVMGGRRYVELLKDLVAAAQEPPLRTGVKPTKSGRKVLRKVIATSWRRTKKAADGIDDRSPVTELHEVRKRAKRARYAAELGTPVFSPDAKKLSIRITEVQDVLGELNDAVTLATWLQEEAPYRLDPSAAFLAGRLTERQLQKVTALRRLWRGSWSEIKPRHTKWLR